MVDSIIAVHLFSLVSCLHSRLPHSCILYQVAQEADCVVSRLVVAGNQFPQQQISATVSGAFSGARRFRLQFISSPAAEAFTQNNLEGALGDTICVRLVDGMRGQPVTEGLGSAAELEVVPLMGHFNIPDEQDWSAEEFKRHVEKGRQGRGQLLAGELKLCLKGGVGSVGLIYFNDNSSWTRSRKFRLGIRVAQDTNNSGGLASLIREGKSTAFLVKDSRGIGYQKHEEPSLTSEVWRLRNIRRNGPFHNVLRQHGIHRVQDFLLWIKSRPAELRKVLGKMPARTYQDTVNHAGKCVLVDKVDMFPGNQHSNENMIFTHNYQTVGAIAQGGCVGLDALKDAEKVQMDALFKNAFDNLATNATECMVGDLATAGKPLINMAVDCLATADGVQQVEPMCNIQAPNDYLINDAPVEELHNIEILPLWDYDISGIPSTNAKVNDDTADNTARSVEDVFSGYEGNVYKSSMECDPTPQTNRWWLKIRAAVRCALFIRNVGCILQQQGRPVYST